MTTPVRGEIWDAQFGQTVGRERAGIRPALIVSVDLFNQSGAELIITIPITSKAKGIRSHVPIRPPEGGLSQPSLIKCEDVRSISTRRLLKRRGTVTAATLLAVEERLRILMGL